MRNGLGQSVLEETISSMTTRAMNAMMPVMKDAIAKASVAAEPMVRRVVVQDVLPKFGLAVVLGVAAGAAISAAIGSHFATRSYRRNPRRSRVRRRAA